MHSKHRGYGDPELKAAIFMVSPDIPPIHFMYASYFAYFAKIETVRSVLTTIHIYLFTHIMAYGPIYFKHMPPYL